MALLIDGLVQGCIISITGDSSISITGDTAILNEAIDINSSREL